MGYSLRLWRTYVCTCEQNQCEGFSGEASAFSQSCNKAVSLKPAAMRGYKYQPRWEECCIDEHVQHAFGEKLQMKNRDVGLHKLLWLYFYCCADSSECLTLVWSGSEEMLVPTWSPGARCNEAPLYTLKHLLVATGETPWCASYSVKYSEGEWKSSTEILHWGSCKYAERGEELLSGLFLSTESCAKLAKARNLRIQISFSNMFLISQGYW